MNNTCEAFGEFLERFGWLCDSLIYHVEFHGNLRYDLTITISLRAQDGLDGLADKSVKLILGGVTEFHLAQHLNWASFETSAGAGIAADGDRVFLDLGSPVHLPPSDEPTNLDAPPRNRSVEDIRKSAFYLDFTNFIGQVSPLEDIVDDHFGALREALFGDVFGDTKRDDSRPPRNSRPD